LKQLHEELRELGFEGSYDRVAAFARVWRAGQTDRVNSASKRTQTRPSALAKLPPANFVLSDGPYISRSSVVGDDVLCKCFVFASGNCYDEYALRIGSKVCYKLSSPAKHQVAWSQQIDNRTMTGFLTDASIVI
jgi:hypothetical protein